MPERGEGDMHGGRSVGRSRRMKKVFLLLRQGRKGDSHRGEKRGPRARIFLQLRRGGKKFTGFHRTSLLSPASSRLGSLEIALNRTVELEQEKNFMSTYTPISLQICGRTVILLFPPHARTLCA